MKFHFLSFFVFLFIISNVYSQTENLDELFPNHNNIPIHIKHKAIMEDFQFNEESGSHTYRDLQKQEYDSSSVVDSIISIDSNGDNSERGNYTYDSNGNIVSVLNEDWDGTQWVNNWRKTYSYDSNGNVISILDETWDGSQWVNDWRHTYTYDSSGNRISILEETWDGSQWVNDWRNTYTYDSNRNMITDLWERWYGNQWVNDKRSTYSYDFSGNMISILDEDWDGSQWVNDWRYIYTYDINGNMISHLVENWYGNQWVNAWRYIYTYDINGHMISYLKENINGSQWIYDWRYTYTNDSNGNMIYGKYEKWEFFNWIAADGFFIFKDSFGRNYYIYSCEINVYYSILTYISENDIVINEFSLSQNHPNPFNPITNICFVLPKSSEVKLEIYNLLGQRMAVLVNVNKPVGYHKVQFNANRLPSGVYLYRIQAGSFQKVKKMLLVK